MNDEILSYVLMKYVNEKLYYQLCQTNNKIYYCCINGLKYFEVNISKITDNNFK